MKKAKVNFTFNKDLLPDEYKLSDIKKTISSLTNFVLISERETLNEVNFLFCDDESITEYNKKYLKHHYETDIITFKYKDSNTVESDIIISLESVKRNSLTYKCSYLSELLRVVIHGMLHLCGFQDKTKSQRMKMRKKENYYLKLIGLEK